MCLSKKCSVYLSSILTKVVTSIKVFCQKFKPSLNLFLKLRLLKDTCFVMGRSPFLCYANHPLLPHLSPQTTSVTKDRTYLNFRAKNDKNCTDISFNEFLAVTFKYLLPKINMALYVCNFDEMRLFYVICKHCDLHM